MKYDSVKLNIQSMKSFGVTSGSYGSHLASVLINKLPQELLQLITWGHSMTKPIHFVSFILVHMNRCSLVFQNFSENTRCQALHRNQQVSTALCSKSESVVALSM